MRTFFLLLFLVTLAKVVNAQEKKQYIILSNNDTIQATILQGKLGGKILIDQNGAQKVLNPEEYKSSFYKIIEKKRFEDQGYGGKVGTGFGLLGFGIGDVYIRAALSQNFYFEIFGGVRTSLANTVSYNFNTISRRITFQEETILSFSPGVGGGIIIFDDMKKKSPPKVQRSGFVLRYVRSFHNNEFIVYNENTIMTGATWEYFGSKNNKDSWSFELLPTISLTDEPFVTYTISKRQWTPGLNIRVVYTYYSK